LKVESLELRGNSQQRGKDISDQEAEEVKEVKEVKDVKEGKASPLEGGLQG